MPKKNSKDIKVAEAVVETKDKKKLTKIEKIAIIEGAIRWIGHDPVPGEVKDQLNLLLEDVKK